MHNMYDFSSDDEFEKEISSQRSKSHPKLSISADMKENIPPGGLLDRVRCASNVNCAVACDVQSQNSIDKICFSGKLNFDRNSDSNSDFESQSRASSPKHFVVSNDEALAVPNKQTSPRNPSNYNQEPNKLVPYLKQKFKSFQKGFKFANRRAADAGFCWIRTTKLKDWGPKSNTLFGK